MTHVRKGRPIWVVGSVAVLVFLLDQGTKAWVRAHIPLNGALYPIPAVRSFFRLTHLTNTGVAFGFLQNMDMLYLIILAVLALTVVLYARHLPWHHPLIQVAAGMQLGGALGNLADRFRLGHVTDFIDFFVTIGGRTYHYPPFNVADASIVMGVSILFLVLWRLESQQDQAYEGDGRIPGDRGHISL